MFFYLVNKFDFKFKDLCLSIDLICFIIIEKRNFLLLKIFFILDKELESNFKII